MLLDRDYPRISDLDTLTLLCLLMELSSPLSFIRRHKLLMGTPPVATFPACELMTTSFTSAMGVRLPTLGTLEARCNPFVSEIHDRISLVST